MCPPNFPFVNHDGSCRENSGVDYEAPSDHGAGFINHAHANGPLPQLTTFDCMQSNLISDLSTASRLTSLKHLNLDHNHLSNVTPLTALQQLTTLALENNSVGSLSPLSCLTALVELYAADNRIASMRDVKGLQEARSLLVLDIRGNAVCKDIEYSSYLVYRLHQLRVLDGTVISAASVAAARAKYAGRLTLDFIEEKAGRTKWSQCVLVHATFVCLD
jgi:hypothetical protein